MSKETVFGVSVYEIPDPYNRVREWGLLYVSIFIYATKKAAIEDARIKNRLSYSFREKRVIAITREYTLLQE